MSIYFARLRALLRLVRKLFKRYTMLYVVRLRAYASLFRPLSTRAISKTRPRDDSVRFTKTQCRYLLEGNNNKR